VSALFTRVDLSDSFLGDAGFAALCGALRGNGAVREVVARGCGVRGGGAEALGDLLAGDTRLRTVGSVPRVEGWHRCCGGGGKPAFACGRAAFIDGSLCSRAVVFIIVCFFFFSSHNDEPTRDVSRRLAASSGTRSA
jgi:hypothetical protein